MRHLLYLSLMFLVVVLCGCKYAPLPAEKTPEATQTPVASVDPEQKELLEGILDYQKKTGSTLDGLAKEIERRKGAEAQAMGPSPLQRDYNVARALLVAARRAAQSELRDETAGALKRLRSTIGVMLAEAPAAQIRVFLERGILALQGSAGGVEADVASASLLAALDVALRAPDAPLVPADIAKPLEKAKQQVDGGDYKDALKAMESLVSTCSSEATLLILIQAEGGVRGAQEAMARNAWSVVLAELDNLSDVLNRLGTELKAAPPAVETETTGEEESADSAAAEKAAPTEGDAKSETPAETDSTGARPEAGKAGAKGKAPAAGSAPETPAGGDDNAT